MSRIDLECAEDFRPWRESFDTVVCLNVLEHVADPRLAMENMASALVPGGRVVLYVPQGQSRYCSLDEVLGHRCRYDEEMLREEVAAEGLELEHLAQFNRVTVPGWWWNGKLLRRRSFGRWQLKAFDVGLPLVRFVDKLLPWKGLGFVAVARKPQGTGSH